MNTEASARTAFYADLPQFGMGALWTVLGDALTPEPRVRSVPYIWRYKDVRPRVLRAGELVTAEEAERRVLMLMNPGLDGKPAATATLYAGVQLILPGEVARTHRHTPSALRFIIEGAGGYTTVNGEKAPMRKGDYLTTPNWTWHDHGNDGDEPVLWLDGLDIPLVTNLDAIFLEEFGESRQPIVKPTGDSIRRWGSNLRPTWETPAGTYSPILNYRWESTRAALHGLREVAGSPFDGVIMEYINPCTGGPTLPTMAAYLQLLRRGEHAQAHRHVASTVYHVAEGGGFSVIAGERFDWAEGDTFVVPAWAWHEHASQGGEAVLFSFSDRPVLQALGLDREEKHAAARQE
ncbi:MAG: cupin domain-containing protein [Dehalococcoidia bacterium]